jgi:hypothetical protein
MDTNAVHARPTRRALLVGGAALAGALGLGEQNAFASSRAGAPALLRGAAADYAPATMRRWAADTWRSMVAMTDPTTGLIADNIPSSLTGRSAYTSPTNIGGYLWSAVVAREVGIITPGECTRRVRQTLQTLLRGTTRRAAR